METFKIVFVILSVIFSILAFVLYIKEMHENRTKPHTYTWFVWILTQGTAAFAVLYGKGGLGSLELFTGLIFIFIIFIYSFKNGTKNITVSDTVVLIFALLAVFVWWQLHDPILSVFMVCCIDGFGGYIPTFRKLWQEPWSENVTTWLLFNLGNIFAVVGLRTYNFLTLAYLITIILFNFVLIALCLLRRRKIKKPML